MTGLSHAMISWGISQKAGTALRDRRLAAWAGVAADFDSISYLVGLVMYRNEDDAFFYFSQVHHRYTHGFAFVLLALAVGIFFGRNRIQAGLTAALAAGIHIVCDLIGSGPDWPVYLWWPLSNEPLAASWSSPVTSLPNMIAGIVLTVLAFGIGAKYGRTPFEMISSRLDNEFCSLVKKRFSKEEQPEQA